MAHSFFSRKFSSALCSGIISLFSQLKVFYLREKNCRISLAFFLCGTLVLICDLSNNACAIAPVSLSTNVFSTAYRNCCHLFTELYLHILVLVILNIIMSL